MKTNPSKPQQARSLIQVLGVCALVSALGLVLISRSRAQTPLVEEVAEPEAVEGAKADDALAAEVLELLSKPIPPYTRAFDRLAELVGSNEVQTLTMMDAAELEPLLEKLKSPAERQAEALSMFAILHPLEYAAVVSALIPVEKPSPENLSDTDLALFAETNTAPISAVLAARVKALPSAESMRLAAQVRIPTDFGHGSDVRPDSGPMQAGHRSD